MNFLRIEDLHIDLGESYLCNVSFDLEKGDYMMIIGLTGAVKTILMESIVGFWKPHRGRIHLEGKNITNKLPEKLCCEMFFMATMTTGSPNMSGQTGGVRRSHTGRFEYSR